MFWLGEDIVFLVTIVMSAFELAPEAMQSSAP